MVEWGQTGASSTGNRTAQNPFFEQPLGMSAPIEGGRIPSYEVPIQGIRWKQHKPETAQVSCEDKNTGCSPSCQVSTPASCLFTCPRELWAPCQAHPQPRSTHLYPRWSGAQAGSWESHMMPRLRSGGHGVRVRRWRQEARGLPKASWLDCQR